ncbi:DUF3768 domain-containing protein [Aquidulcibacter paucihalophilus]|nr:DUF3768 domain-containing protein [Aquidulcibacter paucihalophilus]
MNVERRERIRALNDRLRRQHVGGRILVSSGIMAGGPGMAAAALVAVRHFDKFDERNDPYGEHDFGAVTVGAQRIFWKIDYYDASMTSHAVDPSDPAACVRVLSIMLAEEY